uniref:Cruciferin (Fragments) n=1 Tax=Sinapis alba TaxID=3728 RepID=CRU1_SINAL|nr:RecName: Full=Cruciferin; AltName: Full=11S globulin; AltName: Full=12S storage protein; AltName: Allergen=Sin a 2; Contains: RecName: Full=Cruciferin alpha chain; Contains: RecName: Full=Cruciferin beta chain [Sinapis alba]
RQSLGVPPQVKGPFQVVRPPLRTSVNSYTLPILQYIRALPLEVITNAFQISLEEAR